MRFPGLPSLRTDRVNRSRGARIVTATAAVAAAFSLVLPAAANAAPAPQTPKVDQRVLDSLGAFAPAIICLLYTSPSPRD